MDEHCSEKERKKKKNIYIYIYVYISPHHTDYVTPFMS